MSTPAPRPTPPPAAPTPRRSWLVPAAAAAVLVAAGAWLVAPAVTSALEDKTAQAPAAAAPSASTSAPGANVAAPAPSPYAPIATPTPSWPPSPHTTSSPAPNTVEPGDTGQAPPEQVWRPVAEGFAVDFATPGDDWGQRLAVWTTPELAAAYASTDPIRQPSAQWQDLQVTEEGPTSVGVLVTYTDTGAGDLALHLQVLLTPDGWQVASARQG